MVFKATDYCLSGPSLLPGEVGGGLAQGRRPSLGSGVELGLPVVLSRVVFAGVDPYSVVHDAVGYGVGDGVAAEPVVPFLGHRSGGERDAGRVVAEVHELEQESFEWLVGLVDEPFVDGEQVVGGVFAHELGHASGQTTTIQTEDRLGIDLPCHVGGSFRHTCLAW